MEALKLKIEELNAEIEAFQAQLPEHGTQSIHRHGGAPPARATRIRVRIRIQVSIFRLEFKIKFIFDGTVRHLLLLQSMH